MENSKTETEDEAIRERYRGIYKDMRPLGKDDFSNPAGEQKKELQKQEAKYGKIIAKKEKEEDEEGEKQTNAEKVLDAATQNIQKLFVDEYQVPHAPYL